MTPVYLDCNATTPLDPEVLDVMHQYLVKDFGNEGSHTHHHGTIAKAAVNNARDFVAKIINCSRNEITFTSGATESNNIAILGLMEFGIKEKRNHIITTSIEHKAVLEPLQHLEKKGFEIDIIKPDVNGKVDPKLIEGKIKKNTLLISVMSANNETGVIQPIEEIAAIINDEKIYFHVDAAQSFGKIIEPLQNRRIDLISISGHKIYGPKGVGILITRLRNYEKPPLTPLIFGGGQERGLRPGTLPVFLIAGLGKATELALKNHEKRNIANKKIQKEFINFLKDLKVHFNGDLNNLLPNTINFSIPGVDSEAFMLLSKELMSVSNGSACTTSNYQPSHVISAMTDDPNITKGAIRISWFHETKINNDFFVGFKNLINQLN
jgi:cysteine desulfurase